MDEQLWTLAWCPSALCVRPRMTRIVRPWPHKGRWSPEEAAGQLHGRRGELLAQLQSRSEGRGIPPGAREEIVDDAITAVVMSPRGVANEDHLLGAFWLAVDHRCRRHREGRHLTRLGSRRRIELELAAQWAPVEENPFDALAVRDRIARAADLMADLDARERQVFAVMASQGVGAVSAARLLGLPRAEARAAARSANMKLDRIAVIYAAGRMCEFRAAALSADAAGQASECQARLARAHMRACVPCSRMYRRMRREMRGREFQRAAVAAFLPIVPVPTGHVGGMGSLAIWIEQRLSFIPRGSGGRAAEVLGGAGIAKAAVAGTAIVAAGGALTGHILPAIEGTRKPPADHRGHVPRQPRRATVQAVSAMTAIATQSPRPSGEDARVHLTSHTSPKPPSKSLAYLALGVPAATSTGSASGESAHEPTARAASVTSSATEAETGSSPSGGAPPPTHSGGGTSLSYLGR
jgi:DNA-directed RNA polymerase specialized sigma24 family protein